MLELLDLAPLSATQPATEDACFGPLSKHVTIQKLMHVQSSQRVIIVEVALFHN